MEVRHSTRDGHRNADPRGDYPWDVQASERQIPDLVVVGNNRRSAEPAKDG